MHRVERVGDDQPLGMAHVLGQRRPEECRRAAGDDRRRRRGGLDRAQQLLLGGEVFGRVLLDPARRADGFLQRARRHHATGAHGLQLADGRLQLRAALGQIRQALGRWVEGADLEAGGGEDGDPAGADQAAADDGDGGEVSRKCGLVGWHGRLGMNLFERGRAYTLGRELATAPPKPLCLSFRKPPTNAEPAAAHEATAFGRGFSRIVGPCGTVVR